MNFAASIVDMMKKRIADFKINDEKDLGTLGPVTWFSGVGYIGFRNIQFRLLACPYRYTGELAFHLPPRQRCARLPATITTNIAIIPVCSYTTKVHPRYQERYHRDYLARGAAAPSALIIHSCDTLNRSPEN